MVAFSNNFWVVTCSAIKSGRFGFIPIVGPVKYECIPVKEMDSYFSFGFCIPFVLVLSQL